MNTPEVTDTGDAMVYSVRSNTNPARRYRCDLIAENGYGRCDCKDWGTRRWPAIKAKRPAGVRATLCRHLIAARRHFLNGLLRALAMEEQTPMR